MTDKKISELDAITGSNTAATDVFVVVDTSTGQTKKITRQELNNAIERDVLDSIDIDTIQGDFAVNGSMTITGTVDGRDVAADGTKLDGIEASATADQTASEIKTAYESNADTNEFSDAEQTKLAGIEASATADQTASEIKTAYESNADTNEFSDAEQTKLAGIEAAADVTDTTNVTAAGAAMLTGATFTGSITVPNVTSDAISLDPTTGYANIEMGGPDGSYIDLKSPFSDDYDGRIITSGTGLAITTGSGSGSVDLQHQNATKLSTSATGIDVTGTVTADGLTVDTNTLYVDSTNNRVGVGLTDPTAALEVESTDALLARFSGGSTTAGTKYIQVVNTSDDTAGLNLVHHSDDHASVGNEANSYLSLLTNDTERARLETDGDLHVDGNVIAYSTTISDIRLKKDVAPIENAVTKVQQLNGCTFTYLKDDRKSAGLIAQDVEKVLPSAVIDDEAVFHGEEGEVYKTVQYDQVIGLLVEAVKELKAEIEELKDASNK